MTQDELRAEIEALEAAAHGRAFTLEERNEWHKLNADFDEVQIRDARIKELALNPNAREEGATFSVPALRRGRDPHAEPREQGLRTIERLGRDESLSPEAGDRLEELVRSDRSGVDSRYLAAVSDPSYATAFGKLVTRPDTARHEFDDGEAAAVRAVGDVMSERALAEGTGSTGGYAVPVQIDPSILLSSNGAINPLRELATVTTTTTNRWTGVSSDGVVASFDTEGAEVSDDTPILAQPVVNLQMARA